MNTHRKCSQVEADGWCHDSEVFKQIWNDNPKAPLELTVRNFNFLANHRVSTQLKKVNVGWNRVYHHNMNLEELFPISIAQMKKFSSDGSGIVWREFVKFAPAIAAETKRAVTICHQEGGDSSSADYSYYGPTLPNKRNIQAEFWDKVIRSNKTFDSSTTRIFINCLNAFNSNEFKEMTAKQFIKFLESDSRVRQSCQHVAKNHPKGLITFLEENTLDKLVASCKSMCGSQYNPSETEVISMLQTVPRVQ